MTEKRIADLWRIKNRFLRSTQLERDFRDPGALSGYVATKFVESCLKRISEGLREGSGQRAWRLTGHYGSGKSSFALFLARGLAGGDNHLPPQLRKVIELSKCDVRQPGYLPVLVTCSRQPLGSSLLQAVLRALEDAYKRGSQTKAATRIGELLQGQAELTDDQVVDALLEANTEIIADSKGLGLLLIIDELGKFLEYAALHPDRQDVFLLQRLAESASRSKDEPLFLVCLLHQGFDAYAEHLDPSAQREWDKITGRFEEIIFNQPVSQIGHLIASALDLNVGEVAKRQKMALQSAMNQCIELGWLPAQQRSELLDLSTKLFPLHPTVLPVLVRIFRNFGQNERSLFSFLLSNEPFGLRAFGERSSHTGGLYRLHDLFDYVRTNFGHRLAVRSYRSHWNLIDSVVESYIAEDETQARVLKTVGILNLLNDDLLPTEEALLCALADEDPSERKEVRACIERLRKIRRVLYDRGHRHGLTLWSHTSVDLERAYDKARQAIGTPRLAAALMDGYLETRPLVARRHYIETGNLRHYEVRYRPVSELPGLLEKLDCDADGLILVPLCESPSERNAALKFARAPVFKDQPNWLVAVPQPLNNLARLVQEVQRWDWVATNTLELNGDKYGREEVSRQQQAARAQLERRVRSLIGLKEFSDRSNLDWFRLAKPAAIKDARQLLLEVSRFLDETYDQAPRINNELLNRRNLSSAAAAARMRLIERMFSHGKDERLGMSADKKPPEMSMYLSVLLNTGVHQRINGSWRIGAPSVEHDEKCNLLPALQQIREIVQREPDGRVNVASVFEELRKPRFGVRDGLLPVLLTVFAIDHEHDVAFYKDGSFIREMAGEDMLVLSKHPQRFDIQYCRIEGVRADLFEKLLNVLELKPKAHERVKLLDVVKPLCVFAARLPDFVHNTKKLSSQALAVRDVILIAKEPARLVFTELPRACGFKPFASSASDGKEVQAFVRTLKRAVDELRASFPELQGRLRQRLRDWFDLPGSFQEFRTALAARGHQVVLSVTEPRLKAFCLRLIDDSLPEMEWLESVGSFLAVKPPSKWHDAEEDLFSHELAQLATRFLRVESILFAGGKSKRSIGVRVSITQANGVEQEQVIHFNPEEEHQLRELQAEFERILADGSRLGLAAASRAIWAKLERTGKSKP